MKVSRSGGATVTTRHIIYECGICGCYHKWSWRGDCRYEKHRIEDPDEYAEKLGVSGVDVEVRTMDERVAAHEAGL